MSCITADVDSAADADFSHTHNHKSRTSWGYSLFRQFSILRANKRKSCENKDKEVHGQRQRRKWIFICLAVRRNMKQKPQPKSTKDKKRKIRNRKTRKPGLDLTSTDIVNGKSVKRRRIVNGIPLHFISNQINFFDSLHCASIRAFECQLLCPPEK